MESEIALTSIFILVLVVTATAKSALDELSDVTLRRLASDTSGSGQTRFWRSIIDHYQQFHQITIARRTSWLHYENIRTANVFPDLEIELAVRKTLGYRLAKFTIELGTDLFGQLPMSIARKDLDFSRYAHVLKNGRPQ